ncbi:HesB/IscA family protein [Roseibacillus ishigakijimensis]|uniref:Iron-sulfur cluster assembly accessory protein n=1 Tax=Roseibacillus ishigakijimensis TaxID=454146 RepID=A0A934VHG0_9BACT|nr:iron-sulfur cluster assembly accessory protein [Roseibacillus ishigakijimensis]MBK1833913.1 iron-sulfur cluster assembly accessory protein [Roseibacillus ishigakijimensis]
MITLTPKAVIALKDLLAKKEAAPTAGLRLAIERGGCAGLAYTMKVAEAGEDDTVVEEDGTRVIIPADSLDHLRGSTLDFSDSLSDAGFKITNPNAARSCGCGTSFEPAEEGKKPEYDPALDGTACR